MIVFYEDDGTISATLKGGYDISRHKTENKNWIEVENQSLENKKVDPETEELVKVN